VRIETAHGDWSAPLGAAPLTHWNTAAFARPLFNPQTGKALKCSAVRHQGETLPTGGPGLRWTVRGEAEIDDWYDAGGTWVALRGRLPDKSMLEYRRI
jgi:hypothetical protein